VIYPQRVLSAPEHFEFALNAATGDYVSYLTDKMVILPTALAMLEAVIAGTKADIVNWAYAPYAIDQIHRPSGSGTLIEDVTFLRGTPEQFDPLQALRFKASGEVPRSQQSTRDYALGKIIFGCYSRALIERIRATSGTLFGGATHDYSAMVQALSLAGSCVMLNGYGVIFITLPRDQSLGSLTATEAQWALRYYHAFTDKDRILEDLLVPQLYASQHNMVAHDYKKFLPIYDNLDLFNRENWLGAIADDLNARDKVWSDKRERAAQLRLFGEYLTQAGLVPKRRPAERLSRQWFQARLGSLLRRVAPRTGDRDDQPFQFKQTKLESLDDAVRQVLSKSSVAK
jgi:hypothetical protein